LRKLLPKVWWLPFLGHGVDYYLRQVQKALKIDKEKWLEEKCTEADENVM